MSLPNHYKYIPDFIYKFDKDLIIHVEITRKITNNILNKYKVTITQDKTIKHFLICDENDLYKLDFNKDKFEKIYFL